MNRIEVYMNINPDLYKKNPESTNLGKRIVSKSVEMIHDMGFEDFTFKKLGAEIGSNESSIYRYFESKHVLLIFLINWYWSWLEYKLAFQVQDVKSAEEKLKTAIELLTKEVTNDNNSSSIDAILLHKIIVDESSKGYHTKSVDAENEKGFFKSYKRVVQHISDLALECNPQFEFPHMLVSTVIEGAHQQRYFSQHLPSLTDFEQGKNNIVRFYTNLVFKVLGIS